ncbi:class I SAM-dependent methyltransferase [Chengkuizengella axinellae]|uniref:Methyltransferase domain-containing protein n=1 Tax=Chengkuizengella axinellae TaxID=3064388 RepID=A0ABT9J4A0_9BACL|nr:methyltransferase domain-containing protein [Chengkuizengella sp. 2205SS18-9]MDP5276439.1 methyltransferase domain-containing protein [Chengkuizengella sp. 2205SS18-9]
MQKVPNYYNTFSTIYDFISFQKYYGKAREEAVKRLQIKKNMTIINVACGTGQNFKYVQQYLKGTGLVIGLDFSNGMLDQANKKIINNQWNNIRLIHADAKQLSYEDLRKKLPSTTSLNKIDCVICDLGLTAIENWQVVIDNMLNVVKDNGRIVIMDWYMEELTFRGKFVNWIGKSDITRPTWKYFKKHVDHFELDHNYNRGGVFVASGNKKINR